MPHHMSRHIPTLAFLIAAVALPAGAQQSLPPVERPDSALKPELMRRDSVVKLQTVEIRGSVSGRGRTRNANAIDNDQLRIAPAGSSALKVVERLPGVNFQSADPFGMYEWSNRVTIRGFQTQQIGQTFDGLPLGDMSYGNFNGLGIGRAVDSENLIEATVAQGSGALGTASSNNLGGAIQYASTDPANRSGVDIRQMVGEATSRRTFVRLSSGLREIGTASAYKAFISASRSESAKWKGAGIRYSRPLGDIVGDRGVFGANPQNWRDQINAKLQGLFGEHKITAFYNFSDQKEADYTDLSLARYRQSGRLWDQYASWDSARTGASGPNPDEAYFYSAEGARKDHLAYVAADFKVGPLTHFLVTPYVHRDKGAGDWHAPSYGAAYSPDSIMFRQSQYDDRRYGATARLTTVIGASLVEGGLWYEDNTTTIRRPRWRLVNYAQGPEVNFGNELRLDFDRTGAIKTATVYLQSTTALLDEKLRVTYGAKYLHVGAEFHNNGNTDGAPLFADAARPSLSVPTDGGVLPQVGAVYAATETEQLFANYSVNVNAYPYSPSGGVYATSPAAFNYFKSTAKPEKAYTYEVGVRTKRAGVEGSLALYTIDYRNRLLGIASCAATVTCASVFGNVGSVSSRGAEALLQWQVTPELVWLTSGAYNRSAYNDDYTTGKTVVSTSGKRVVDAPEFLASSGFRLTVGSVLAGASGRYVDKRYFTYTNDLSVPAYATIDAHAGYRVGEFGAAHDLLFQINVTNVFDKDYISTLGSNGFTASGDNQTLLAGARRLVYITVGSSF
ncbi:MAG: TonB-dependent receptor [Gemmatimonadaceae bacterium]